MESVWIRNWAQKTSYTQTRSNIFIAYKKHRLRNVMRILSTFCFAATNSCLRRPLFGWMRRAMHFCALMVSIALQRVLWINIDRTVSAEYYTIMRFICLFIQAIDKGRLECNMLHLQDQRLLLVTRSIHQSFWIWRLIGPVDALKIIYMHRQNQL